jgi:ubiquitin-conjugating enzyme E2 variant
MGQPRKVQQRSASELSHGYSPAVRRFEISSIAVFAGCMIWLASRFVGQLADAPFLALTALGLAYVAADLVSGLVHWAADTWGTPEWPVIGKALIRPFREHHVDALAITRHDFIETNGNNCAISILPAVGGSLLKQGPELIGNFFAATFLFWMLFFVFLTNQFHKWSHEANPPRAVQLLQKLHLVLPHDHHQIHHKAPFAKYYCITVGWLNEPLHRIKFFRAAEWLIAGATGLVPREDDIGRKAAIEVLVENAPKPEGEPVAKLPPAV